MKGYALIEFEKYEIAEAAIKGMNGGDIYDKKIKVDWAFKNPPPKKEKYRDKKRWWLVSHKLNYIMEPDKSAITDKMFAVHAKYFSPIAFDEVEHIPNEFKTFESDITLQEGCLLISYNFFEKYYTELIKILSNEQVSHNLKSVAADLVLCMNG